MAGAYRAACTSAGSRMIAAVEEAYDSGATELLCKKEDMVDLDVAPLTVALLEANPFTTVDLSCNHLGAGAAESLKQLLERDGSALALDLSLNDFSESAVAALCDGLKTNTTLTDLRLSGNKLRNPGGMAVAKLLQENTTLRKLHLANCELDTASVVALATVLRTQPSLMVLDLSRSLARTIMDEHTAHIARMLKVNTALVDLDLSKSGLRDLGLQLIAEELFRAGPDSRLQVLRCRANAVELVSEECVSALALLLRSHTCRLKEVLLGSNSLRDEGALKLAEMVQQAGSLQRLDVSSNGISSRGLCALARAVSSHPVLQEVELWGNRFDSAACVAWIQPLQFLKLDIAVQEVDGSYNCVRC